jgi:hypothetical protein
LRFSKSATLANLTKAEQLPTLAKFVLNLVALDLNAYLLASTSASVDIYGRTVLHWASGRDYEVAIRSLLEREADMTIAERTGLTAIHVANSAAVVMSLLTQGTQIKYWNSWMGNDALSMLPSEVRRRRMVFAGGRGGRECYGVEQRRMRWIRSAHSC